MINHRQSNHSSDKERDEMKLNDYLSELELDLVSQHKPIEVLKKLQATRTYFCLEINCRVHLSNIPSRYFTYFITSTSIQFFRNNSRLPSRLE